VAKIREVGDITSLIAGGRRAREFPLVRVENPDQVRIGFDGAAERLNPDDAANPRTPALILSEQLGENPVVNRVFVF
jgi:hypothetical protein